MIKTDSLIAPILKNLGIEEGVRLAQVKNNWHKIFAKPLSQHMFPSKLSGHELLLNVDSPIWLQQLSYYKREITQKLESYGVKDVRFRLGRISQKKQTESHTHGTAELSSEDAFFIEDVVSGIGDETIKESAKRAIEKSLTSIKHPR